MTPSDTDLKQQIAHTLARFASGKLGDNARDFFNVLGYKSDKTVKLASSSPQAFVAEFAGRQAFNEKNAWLAEWTSAELIFQLTSAEVAHAGQRTLFEGDHRVDNKIIESYLFLAIGLRGDEYSRTQLAAITREVNKIFPMPALILFQHGTTVTLAVIDRRLHKRDESKDVLEKVTLIKDIRVANPHRAHIEILFDLALDQLREKNAIANWVDLYNAWRQTLDTSELNKKFFREIANWYFWAQSKVKFPKGAGKNEDERKAISVIRLLTRLIFVWFVREKNLVPDELFDERAVKDLTGLRDLSGLDSTYYKAILQNLFFGTLNTEMGTRDFRHQPKQSGGRADDYLAHNRYRYEKLFKKSDGFLKLCAPVPFLNGGLFECLDKSEDERVDGFSDRPDNELVVPDELFFGKEREIDLNETFGTSNKRYKVRGLIHIFDSYKFTVDENTPIEEEIALDPELLGKVFENLLAAYNPETGVTARKQTGSFYTPREIVNYMVDESLVAYLETKLYETGNYASEDSRQNLNTRLRHLLAYNDEPHQFNQAEVDLLIRAIDQLKALDPACGSGAFPMGMLHKLVYVLRKLDPDNTRWKAIQVARANKIADADERASELVDIEDAFGNDADYARKLYIIENCLYGVDIQPIAVQIAKLRCFISLIVDDKVDDTKDNRGIRPLPNLETKFVAANSLIGIEKPTQLTLRNPAIDAKEKELAGVRKKHFTARTTKTKEKYRQMDAKLRAEIGKLLREDGFARETTEKLAGWNPYDANVAAEFFDPEWMFGVSGGFDVLFGNPPYVRPHKIAPEMKALLWQYYRPVFEAKSDLYACFIQKSIELLRSQAVMTFIVSKTWLSLESFEELRKFILRNTSVRLLSVPPEKTFESATVETIVVLFEREPQEGKRQQNKIDVTHFDGEQFVFERAIPQNLFDGTHLHTFDLSLNDFALNLNQKMQRNTKPLEECVQFFYGIKTGDDSKFVHEKKLTPQHKKMLRRSDFTRYATIWNGEYVWYVPDEMRKHRQTARPGDPERFESRKIMVQDIGKGIVATLDEEKYYVKDALLLLKIQPGLDLEYILGVLNSRLIGFYYSKTFTNLSVAKNAILTLPIRVFDHSNSTDKENGKRISSLVDHILSAKRKDPDADTSALEREIDALVYQLYGLTAEEIKTLEHETRERAR